MTNARSHHYQVSKFTRNDEQKVNKCQINSKVQITKDWIESEHLEFGFPLTFGFCHLTLN
jgi:hypothetical protein